MLFIFYGTVLKWKRISVDVSQIISDNMLNKRSKKNTWCHLKQSAAITGLLNGLGKSISQQSQSAKLHIIMCYQVQMI